MGRRLAVLQLWRSLGSLDFTEPGNQVTADKRESPV